VVVGTLRLEVLIPNARTLKDKRRVVRSLIDRLRHRFRVAAAEVEDNDVHNHAVLGFAAVSNEVRHAQSVLTQVVEFVRNSPNALLGEYDLEIL
jgi:uncharacterized protein YlxP (DUF503 family)